MPRSKSIIIIALLGGNALALLLAIIFLPTWSSQLYERSNLQNKAPLSTKSITNSLQKVRSSPDDFPIANIISHFYTPEAPRQTVEAKPQIAPMTVPCVNTDFNFPHFTDLSFPLFGTG